MSLLCVTPTLTDSVARFGCRENMKSDRAILRVPRVDSAPGCRTIINKEYPIPIGYLNIGNSLLDIALAALLTFARPVLISLPPVFHPRLIGRNLVRLLDVFSGFFKVLPIFKI